MMLVNYNYHIWFKACKPIKGKYKLSTNCLLILNGSYIYSQTINKDFTEHQLLRFVTYYNNVKLGGYIKVLIKLGYLTQSGLKRNTLLYSVSLLGLSVIQELNASYECELIKFCTTYNVIL